MKEQLIHLGFTQDEAETFLALLKESDQTATILARSTGINRTVIYHVLQNLANKGLIIEKSIQGVKHFSSAPLSALSSYIDSKKEIVQMLLPQLREIVPEQRLPVKVEVYQSIQGGLAILKDIIKTGKDYLAFGEDRHFREILGTLAEQYVRQLKEKKIKEKLLIPQGQEALKSKYSEVRYLPKDIRLPTITAVYGEKVAHAIFQKPYYGIVITSKDLATSYTSLFNYLWSIAKKSN
ncbi:MAG: helix-turn-helix domain-containing protein [Nanoarchaeota archaeon]